ncbi:Cytidylate kinase [Alkalidesulfovibrio alkalitolerans DSM 16529]|jgi:cytidylate kinase|uniref:Cytidylate kinase n=1 Tax=Alkalidesulfovibrio alkalitolerans DSM 16529 TaxID=1121439 RepID=S7TFW4_9BACT|nr:(d)CMP kinase [Alkalidesulfovibrio alkalitolerans]EPR35500.1 Cytidylate kinase [Alkalidesulfovibrio alkalitolerans DSM 16529]
MAERLIVTLDGPAGVGKTTLARRLAEELGVAYLDTGAMFRAIGFSLGEGARDWPEEKLSAELATMRFAIEGAGADTRLLVNGHEMGDEIRSEKVGLLASAVGTLPPVREALKRAQREIGRECSLVAEGRDMGTVVFPEARVKFFLDATPEERATRRVLQLRQMGQEADYDAILVQIKVRDAQDRNRAVAPLKPAEDAIIVDTTKLDVDQVFAELKRLVASAA